MDILTRLPLDKRLHIAAGALIALVVTLLLLLLPTTLMGPYVVAVMVMSGAFGAPGLGFSASVIAGAAKEIFWDLAVNEYRRQRGKTPLHDVDVYDFLATAAGGFSAAVAMCIVIAAVA